MKNSPEAVFNLLADRCCEECVFKCKKENPCEEWTEKFLGEINYVGLLESFPIDPKAGDFFLNENDENTYLFDGKIWYNIND